MLEEKGELISHETIYQHIHADKKSGGTLFNHLRRKGKVCQHRSKSQAGRGHIKNRVSIDERPAEVDEKERIGDWEIVSPKEVESAIVQLNNRPRKKLNYQTPAQLMAEHMAALTA